MKTQILYLEPEDDQASVRDKIAWAKAPRIVLVWPARGRALTRRLDLRLLQRAAERKGIQIALICLDPDVRANADHLGIPTFDSLEEMPEEAWRTAVRKLPRQQWAPRSEPMPIGIRTAAPMRRLPPALRGLIFALPWVGLLAMTAFFLPSARIVLTPPSRPVERTLSTSLTEAGSDRNTSEAELPVQRVSVVVDGELRIPTSGRALIPEKPAEGEVVFTNLTDEPLTIPRGTTMRSLTTTGLFFTTLRPAYLEARNGAETRVPIQASSPGPAGNLAAGAITAIDGPLGLVAAVMNPAPTTGGTQSLGYVVSAADQARVRGLLEERLLEQAAQRLSAMLQEGEQLLHDSLALSEVRLAKYDRELEEPADTIGLQMEVRVDAWSYHDAHLVQAAEEALRKTLSTGEELVPGSLILLGEPSLAGADGPAPCITLEVSALAYTPLHRQAARQALLAVPVEDALPILEAAYPNAESFKLIVRPSWWPRMPLYVDRISILYPWEESLR